MLGSRSVLGRLRALGRRLTGLLRAAVAFGSITAIGSFLWLRSAEARLGETLLGFGDELSRWSAAHPQSAPRAMTINDLELRFMTLTTQLSVAGALDHFQQTCHGGFRAPALAGKFETSVLDGVFRHGTERQGVLACLDTGGALEVTELATRLARVQESGNLNDLGKLRYVLARRSGNTTTLLVLWTEGDARLFNLLPKSGDAPGHDLRDWPRPPGVRRLLSAAEHGQPYAMTLYDAEHQPARELELWYEGALTKAGWRVTRTQGGLLARRGERSVLLQVRSSSSSGKTVVTAAELS